MFIILFSNIVPPMGANGSLLARSQGEEVHAKSLPPISDETLREARLEGIECHFLVRTRSNPDKSYNAAAQNHSAIGGTMTS